MLVSMVMMAGAWASPSYPAEITSYVGTPCDLTLCTVCHDSMSGGTGTVTQPFGMAMMDQGLVLENVDSLHTALDALDTNGTDSDGDGTSDLDELRAGTDPNGGAAFCDITTPTYGCFNTAQANPSWYGVVTAAGGMFALLRRRRA